MTTPTETPPTLAQLEKRLRVAGQAHRRAVEARDQGRRDRIELFLEAACFRGYSVAAIAEAVGVSTEAIGKYIRPVLYAEGKGLTLSEGRELPEQVMRRNLDAYTTLYADETTERIDLLLVTLGDRLLQLEDGIDRVVREEIMPIADDLRRFHRYSWVKLAELADCSASWIAQELSLYCARLGLEQVAIIGPRALR